MKHWSQCRECHVCYRTSCVEVRCNAKLSIIHFADVFSVLLCLDVVIVFHHMLSIVGHIVVLYRGINGTEMMATLFGTEITNPLLQTRFFLRYDRASASNQINIFFRIVVDWLFLILFTVMRIILGSMLLYRYLLHQRPDWVAQFFACSIYLVSWVFWVSIVRYAYRKYFARCLFGQQGQHPSVKSVIHENGSKKTAAINAIGDG